MNNKIKDFFINDFEAKNLTLEENKPSKSKVLYEDTAKRGANIKHFRLQNGNFMAVMYDHPVHKLDPETNKYVDIDSELKETDMDYEAVRDKFKVRMPKTEGNDRFVTMEKDGKEVSWKFVPKNASRRKKSVAVFSRKPKQEPWDIDEYPCVKYEQSDTNIDLQYDISEDGVKESIMLYKHPNCNSFTFKIRFKGLTPVLSEDKKTVLLFCDEEIGSELPEMRIPPAFMEDANEAFCDDIHYEIRQTENETFLDLVLDSDWLSEPERAYPVVIDPRVELTGYGTSKLKMVEIKSQGTSVSSANSNRRIGIDNNGTIHRLYVEFVLPDLADGYDITKAGFVFRQKSYINDTGCSDSYTVAPVSDPNGKKLSVSSFTWENVQSLVIGNTVDTLNGEYRSSKNDIEIDLTKTVDQWYKDSNSSKCLVIKKSNETPCCCNNTVKASYLDLYSMYASSGEYRPKLYIEYKNADTYSDHQKYHTFDVGRAGTGSINLFTGRMSFAHGDVSAEGVRLPLAVSHLYRHEYVNEQENEINKYGKGWKLSVEQTLEIINDHGIKAVYTNAQGKRHYFMYDETNATGDIITDDAGLGLTYREECNCICGKATAHVLTDEKGNKMTFNSNGNLIQLIDTNGNVSCLNYSNSNLTSVVDGFGHWAHLYYDSNNKLIRIEDNNGYNLHYSYEPTGELSEITYPLAENAYEGEEAPITRFFYDNRYRLQKITDNTGISYSLEYDTDGKVKKLSRSGAKRVCDKLATDTAEVFDGTITFDYRASSTAIINERLGIKTVYKFDSNGRELSSYQDMTEAVDRTKISESTITEISGYKSIVDTLTTSRIGKYRSLSVSMCNDANDEINLICNGFFNELDSSSKPTYWSTVGSGSINPTSYIDGKKSYYFSSAYKSKYIIQTVDLCNCELNGNVLVASAWAKSSGSATANTDTSTAKFRMCLKVKYEGGEVEEYFENYDTGYSGWQYAAIPFVLNKECCPIEVTVKLDYSYNSGYCYFTNARLVAVEGVSTTNTYKTDETPIESINIFGECKDIKMTTTTKDSVLTTVDYMDDDSDIVRNTVIDRAGRSYTTDYKYDSKHNLVKMQDYRGIVIEYTYNKYGKECTRKTYYSDNPNVYMFSENTYEDDNFISSERDPRYSHNGEELKTRYTYDKSRGLLLKQTAVNGQEYNYSYDGKTDDLISLSSTTDNNTNENQFFYTGGYLTGVTHNGFNFGFAFDQLGRSKSVTVGDASASTTLLTMNYEEDGVNDVTETVFATGEKNRVTTDILGNPIVSMYTDKNNVERNISAATYDSVGKIKQIVDKERGICYNYTYDAKGNVTKIEECDELSGEVLTTNTFVFDANERLTSKSYGVVGQTYRPVYEKDASGYVYPDNEVMGITLDGKFTDKVTKDGLRRVQRKTFAIGSSTLFEDTYGYLSTPRSGKTVATEIVSSVSSRVYGTSASSETLNYTYDKSGNLETVKRGTELIAKYYYDGLNRLKREDNYCAGKTYIWSYDVGGNILYKKEYALCTDANLGTAIDTKVYTYKSEGWRDRLDSFDGQTCTYDLMGNPLTYLGHNLEWTKVRRLAKFDNNTFEYGANGIRYRKNNTVYTLDGNKILRESDGTKTLTYYHGGSGIVGFEYNGTDYYFRKNLQGDVTEIYTSAGLKVASYAYDAWGKVLEVNNYTDNNVGDINPIRYRSYYYDVETELYYLNSRYYDPETGRFINADTTDVLEDAMYDINGMNLYVYCDNNPVMDRDDGGDKGLFKKLIKAVAVVAVVAVAAAVICATVGTATPLCAAATVVTCAAKGAVIGAAAGAATGAVIGGVQGAIEGNKETGSLDGTLRGMIKGAGKEALAGAQDGMISGMISGAFSGAAASMMGNPMFCFVAGTTVLTTLGKKAIETVQVGDTIPCVDHITGEAAEKKVISTTVNKVSRLIELDIDGEIIQCTETHPFQVKGRGWVDASELTPNDVVYTKDWNTATVKSVNLFELDEPVEVFNFEVEDCHTYFVGKLGVLVHNGGCTEASRKGIQKHKEWNYGEGVRKEVKIGPGARVDGLDEVNKIVYELKPNNVNAINRGLRQLDRYLSILGDDWIGILLTY